MQDTVWGLKQPHCNWLGLTVPPQRTAENELDQVIRKRGILNVHYLRHLLQQRDREAEPRDPPQDPRGGDVSGRKLCPDAGLRETPPCGRYPVGQQKVHEYEAPGGGSGRRLYCRLISFSRVCKYFCA